MNCPQTECDRERVCYILGKCFFKDEVVQRLPSFLSRQILNARSVKQAYQILKMQKYVQKDSAKKSERP